MPRAQMLDVLPAALLCACSSCADGADETAPQGAPPGDDASEQAPAEASAAAPLKPLPATSARAQVPGGLAVSWTEVPGGEGPCKLFVASVVPDPFPRFVWQSCGPGCRVADVQWEPDEWVIRASASGVELQGEIYVRLEHLHGDWATTVISRLSDGASIAAIRAGRDCVSLSGNDAALTCAFRHDFDVRAGVLEGLQPGAKVGWSPWLTESLMGATFQIDSSFGYALLNGAVFLLSPPDYAQRQSVDFGASPYDIVGRGEMIVSLASKDRREDSIKAFTRASGAWWAYTAPQGTVHRVSISETRVAWILVDGLDRNTTLYDAATFWWAERPAPGASLEPRQAGALDARIGNMYLHTGGDFAAALACLSAGDAWGGTGCALHVTNLPSGKVWRIPYRTGGYFHAFMAVSPAEILLGEIDFPPKVTQNQRIVRLVRLDTSQLDALEAASASW
jgi:hypothetical protein